jgi:hypothetical protein
MNLFFQSAHNATVEKSDKYLHFVSIFIAQKIITGLIIQYVSFNNIQKLSVNPTCSLTLELWAVLGL